MHPLLHHAAPGRGLRGRLLRDDAGRRALRPAHPVDEDHRPRAGHRPRCRNARRGPAPRREAPRGDDLPGGGPPGAAHRRPLRPPARPGLVGLPAAGRRRAGAGGLRLPLRPQRPVVHARGDRQDHRDGTLTLLPYGRQSVDESDIEAVASVLRGDWLTTGPAVTAFEDQLSEVSGAAGAVSVTSGTAALHVAYAALGLGRGDEVVTTPLTFVATASCAAILGARVVFADVSEDTGNLDPEAAAAAVTPMTRAIAGVDYAGHPIDAPALLDLAHRNDAALLEDAAHSIGGSLDGRPVGSLADVTTFSFFPTKNLTTAEGGAVVGTDQEVHEFGLNYRLPDLLCALGSSQLQRLPRFKARRDEIVRRYNEGLAGIDELRLPARRPGADPTWHLYPLRVRDGRRRELFEHLRANGIGVQVNYIPVYWHPVFEDLGYKRGMCPVAEEYYSQEISLPLFPDMTDGDVDRVIGVIRGFLR